MTNETPTLWLDRYDGLAGHEGVLSLVWPSGEHLVEKLAFKTGQARHGATSWMVGQSPIPFTSQTVSGEMWLWLEGLQTNQEARPVTTRPAGIGWFFPISSEKGDMWSIIGRAQERTAIGLHPENSMVGSQGCPVVQHRTHLEKVKCDMLFYGLDRLRLLGYKRIPLRVV